MNITIVQIDLTVQCAMDFLNQTQYNIPQNLPHEVRHAQCCDFQTADTSFPDQRFIPYSILTRSLCVCLLDYRALSDHDNKPNQ